ncbi:MFS transporter [Arthrobacter sp. UC242_113]|uniref:MFS transporter n=1 Tax=Arthrobacter sp. UC242_113 TaxID=3374550 RepID=UPI00375718AA
MLACAGIVVSLMQSLIIPLVPQLPRLLNASPGDTTWAITATLLAGAVATPTVGRLGDMYGKRRMLLVSLVLLSAGSVVGALSSALFPMIIARTLQGLAAGVIPLGISIMRDELPAAKLGGATALMSASLGVGGALGLPIAALIAENADWHVLFWVSAGLGVAALVLVLALVPESSVKAGGRFDLAGAAGISAALVGLLLAVSKGAEWGWASAATLGLGTASVAVFIGWGFWELKTSQPLVNLRTLVRRQVLLTNIASLVFAFAMFSMSLTLPQVIQLPTATGYGLGQSLLAVGLVMAPSGFVMMAVAPLSAKISATWGPKWSLMAGALLVAAGYGSGVFALGAIWQLVIISSVIGAGIGIAYGAMPALVMGAVPATETASANSLNTLMRSIGTSLSSAVAGVVLAQLTASMGPVRIPSQAAFQAVMGIGAAAALTALAIAAFLPQQPKARNGSAAH